jgi:hypothetical protein
VVVLSCPSPPTHHPEGHVVCMPQASQQNSEHRKVMHGCNKGWDKTIVNILVGRDADEKAGRECGLEQAHGRGLWGEREGGESKCVRTTYVAKVAEQPKNIHVGSVAVPAACVCERVHRSNNESVRVPVSRLQRSPLATRREALACLSQLWLWHAKVLTSNDAVQAPPPTHTPTCALFLAFALHPSPTAVNHTTAMC